MAKVRVYIPTYKRNNLFARAIDSLLAQTFTDWIAEIHNDCPDDDFPERYIEGLHDERLVIIPHEENLGAVKTFNLFFKNNIKEEFYCLLEDDNWWESTFLETMLLAMKENTDATIAFANHFLWEQKEGNQWEKRNDTRYLQHKNSRYQGVNFLAIENICGYSYSNCSLFIRANKFKNFEIPLQTRGDFMEHVRQRTFIHPLLYVSLPLVNFSLTLDTYRNKSLKGYHEHEALLIASFFRNCKNKKDYHKPFIQVLRSGFGFSINKAMYAGLIDADARFLLSKISLKEWLIFIIYSIRHLGNTIKILQAKKIYKELWEFLCVHTKNRFVELNNSNAQAGN